MPRIRKTAKAEEDLIEIWLYIAKDNPAAADALLDDFEKQFLLLAHNQNLGRARPDIAPQLRYFPSGNYLILYRQIAEDTQIMRIVHGARLIENLSIDG